MQRNRFERDDSRGRAPRREFAPGDEGRRTHYGVPRAGRSDDARDQRAEGEYDADYEPGRQHFEEQGRRFARETGNLRDFDSDRASSYQGPVYPRPPAGADDRPAFGSTFGGRPYFSSGALGAQRDWDRWDRYEANDRGGFQVSRAAQGEAARGGFAGRGPAGYRRSDERIREDICDHLTAHAQIDASQIEVLVENGEATLRGCVATRAQKRLAEDIAEASRGVSDVRNELRIKRDDAPGDERDMTGAPLSVNRRQV